MWGKKNIKIPVEVSARHCHLSKEDLEKLFGTGYELKKLKQLSQPADFACEETLDILVGSKKFEKVRVVGPLREQTQVEISLSDAVDSGVMPQIKLSGELNGTSPVALVGPKGTVDLKQGLIVAKRHIHCSEAQAKEYKLKTGDIVSVEIKGERPIVFKNVILRVRDDYKLYMHLDTDEGNAAGINKIGEGFLIK
jgi:putative phosphotransacetylase